MGTLDAIRKHLRGRIVIVGGPNTGKTTVATAFASQTPYRATDDLIGRPWPEQSEEVARWLDEPGPWLIEGAAAVRGLRKWLRSNEGRPCDAVICLTSAKAPLTPRQIGMARGVNTILWEIVPELERRGVSVVYEE